MGVGDGFWVRLRQRKLVQWAVAYVAAAFAFVQGLDVVAQRFGWPARIEQVIILALAIGFFVALVLAWYHGERGAQKIGGVELLIIALLLAIGGGALWMYARAPQAATESAVVAAPEPLVPGAAAANVAVSPSSSAPEKSVAVLPFANDSGQKDQQYFSDGLSQDLITALTQFEGLKVISRDSAFQFRNSKESPRAIAAKLGVAHLLEGSVQHQGDEVRISVTLVNAADGSTLWSQHYDKPYKDLFALQDAITQAVATALKAKLLTAPGAVVQSDRPPSGDLVAYTAYLRGIAAASATTEQSLHDAIAAFGEAVHLDPSYARAYAAQGFTWARLGAAFLGGTAQQESYGKGRHAVNTALQLDPDLAAGYTARAYLESYVGFDYTAGQADLQHALRLAPNDGDAKYQSGSLLNTLGRSGRAIDLIQQALKTDPRNGQWYYTLSLCFTAVGRLDNAERAIQAAIAVQPQGAANHEQLAIIEILRGDTKTALVAAQQEPPGPWHDIATTLALQIGPDSGVADAALKKLIADYAGDAAYQVAEVYALRRDPDAMFKWLDRAWANRDPGISSLLSDPFILRYRDDPRFAAFCEKVGLPTTTDAVAMQ
jgi:TolB-like protein/Tfp pilus assembly protein PilF